MAADMSKRKAIEILAWLGLILLQSQSIPALLATIQGGANIPLLMPIMTFAGLLCYLARSLAQGDTLYTVGNTIGLLGTGALIIAITYQ